MRGVVISWREHFPRSFENLFWAVFTWQSKVIRVCIGFASVRCAIGLKKLAPLFHPIRSKSRRLAEPIVIRSHIFPALYDSYVYLLWVLIGSLYFLCLLWLVKVITLVLVLRHSIENCSMKYKCSYFTILFALEFHHISRFPCFTRFCFADAIILAFSSVLLLGSKINWTDICPGEESFGDLLWPFCLIPRNKSWRRFLKYLCEVKVWK